MGPPPTQRAIEPSSKGFQLLKSAGWKEGEGLGRAGQGITAPVDHVLEIGGSADTDKRGLGLRPKGEMAPAPGDSYAVALRKRALSALAQSGIPVVPTASASAATSTSSAAGGNGASQ